MALRWLQPSIVPNKRPGEEIVQDLANKSGGSNEIGVVVYAHAHGAVHPWVGCTRRVRVRVHCGAAAGRGTRRAAGGLNGESLRHDLPLVPSSWFACSSRAGGPAPLAYGWDGDRT